MGAPTGTIQNTVRLQTRPGQASLPSARTVALTRPCLAIPRSTQDPTLIDPAMHQRQLVFQGRDAAIQQRPTDRVTFPFSVVAADFLPGDIRIKKPATKVDPLVTPKTLPDDEANSEILDLAPGTLFKDRYTIGEKLAETAMSVVYRAVEQADQIRTVILKLARGRKNAGKLAMEASILGADLHPSFPSLYDSDNEQYISMEEIEGLSLEALLGQERRLPLFRAIDIIMQVFVGLEALHNKGFIHRDVKPGNIMVSWDTASLLDFGIACKIGFKPKDVAGTANYMAPEQAFPFIVDGLDHRVDIYAAGLVLYHAFTGTNPMAGSTLQETINNQLSRPLPRITRTDFRARFDIDEKDDLSAQVDAAHTLLESIIHQTTAKLPEDRIASVAELMPLMEKLSAITDKIGLFELQ